MSRLTDLIAQAKAKDLKLGLELESEFEVLSARISHYLAYFHASAPQLANRESMQSPAKFNSFFSSQDTGNIAFLYLT